MPSKLLPKGIYTPLPTLFTPDEELDLDALRQHVVFVARAGTVPVLAGSAGEAPHLTADERIQLLRTARAALDDAGLAAVPLVAGVGAGSTRETVARASDAAAAGADFAMVIPPGYYAGQLTQDAAAAVRQYFVDVAAASPLPVVLYNFPAVAGGIDLDSDLVTAVARACPNVVGVKLTCASVGKITRITAVVDTPAFRAQFPRAHPEQHFRVIDGYIDILLPSLASGAAGAISGLPNIAPRLCVRLWQLASAGPAPGSAAYAEARRLQNIAAVADGVAARIGIAGLKMLVHRATAARARTSGAPAAVCHPNPRRPLLPLSEAAGDAVMANEHIRCLLDEEQKLGDAWVG